LIVSGGPGWQKTVAGLRDLLPLLPESTRTLPELTSLQTYATSPYDLTGGAVVATGALAQDAEVLMSQADVPLVIRRRVGFGEVRVEQEGENARLIVDARSESGDYLNGYTLQANVVAPDGRVESIEAQQVAPGRYEAIFQPGDQGAYLIGVSAGLSPSESGAAGNTLTDTAGWVLSYSPEYRNLESDPDALYRIAAATNGRVASDDPGEAFAHTLPTPNVTRPVWQWLLALAALLLPFDVAVRRLAISRADVQRGWMRLVNALRLGRGVPHRAPERSRRMDALLRAKGRVRGDTSDTPAPMTPAVTDSPQLARSAIAEKPDRATPSVKPEPPSTSEPAASTTEALLAQKRARRKRRG